jgi:hypothetical protein
MVKKEIRSFFYTLIAFFVSIRNICEKVSPYLNTLPLYPLPSREGRFLSPFSLEGREQG